CATARSSPRKVLFAPALPVTPACRPVARASGALPPLFVPARDLQADALRSPCLDDEQPLDRLPTRVGVGIGPPALSTRNAPCEAWRLHSSAGTARVARSPQAAGSRPALRTVCFATCG